MEAGNGCVRVSVPTSIQLQEDTTSPMLINSRIDGIHMHPFGMEPPEKRTLCRNCGLKVTWLCIGIVIGCLLVGLAWYGNSMSDKDDNKNNNHLFPNSSENITNLETLQERHFQERTCGATCPEHCVNNTCKRAVNEHGSTQDICTCEHSCEPGYRLVNLTTKFVCQPECCPQHHGDAPIAQCCPLQFKSVSLKSGEELCCPPDHPKHTRQIPPETLHSSNHLHNIAMDLCYKTADKITLPSKPKVCTYQAFKS